MVERGGWKASAVIVGVATGALVACSQAASDGTTASICDVGCGADGGSPDAEPEAATAAEASSDAPPGREAAAPDAGTDADAGIATCLPPMTSSGNYYVSTKGSDSNDGSHAHPWATITHADSSIGPGDTVHVLPGTYAENVSTGTSGTATAPVRFVSDCRYGAHIAPSGSSAPLWLSSGDYVDVVGFEIDGGATSAAIGIENHGSFSRVLGNLVHDIPAPTGCTDGEGGAGIVDANYSGSDDDIVGNVVHDVGGASIGVGCAHQTIQGIYHSNLRGHIQDNVVYRISAYGIHMWHAANDVVVTNNTVFDCGWTASGAYAGGGIIVGDGDNPGGVTNDHTTVSNNIVYANAGTGIREYGAVGTNNVYLNNLVYQNGVDTDFIYGTAVGTVAADPQFVLYDPKGTGDWHLQSTSPAIDAGTTSCAAGITGCAPPFDLDGGGRPAGARWDVGAYEYGAAPASWTWY